MARLTGTPNKVAQATRETFKLLLDEQMPQLREDLAKLEPYQRVKVILDLAQFCVPKLRAVEITDDNSERYKPIVIDMQNWQ
jgi:hypothetical protein